MYSSLITRLMVRFSISVVLLCALFFFSLSAFAEVPSGVSKNPRKVLVLSSYNRGYRWTDDVVAGIGAVLGPGSAKVEVDFEYMDAKRKTSPEYLDSLFLFYRQKYAGNDYDLVLCADDPAFHFVKRYQDDLFPRKPIVFCGLNHFEPEMLGDSGRITGVVEVLDLAETLRFMTALHPDVRKIYVVNDDLPTGRSSATELDKVIPSFPDLEFVFLNGLSMGEVQDRVSRLGQDSLVLFLVFFRDGAGAHFSCDESIRLISGSSAVPVYGVWDFFLGHGIVGGKLTSGFSQGKMAAEMALQILSGRSPSELPVIRKNTNRYAFDGEQLDRFGISRAALPWGSQIINEDLSGRKRLLVLHSYDPQMTWVRNIDAGISSVVDSRPDIGVEYDYLDLKRHPEPTFAQRLLEHFTEKYRNSRFDTVLVCDSKAYRFLLAWGERFFPGTPVVFCGVNDFSPADLEGNPRYTGVVEKIDVKATLDLALRLHPHVRRVVVINDRTDVGQSNRSAVEALLPEYADRAEFEFLEDLNMSQVRDYVSKLGRDSLILLLSFNRDRSNNVFSYQESIRLISEKAHVPIYGVWDFYLGHGLLGGMMTSGFLQGETAAAMAVRLIDGEDARHIPVVTSSPNRYMFDYRQMLRFGLNESDLPPGTVILNGRESVFDRHPLLVWALVFFAFAVALGSVIVFLTLDIRRRKRMESELRYYATTDEMTGVVNRRTGLLMLEQQVTQADRDGKPLSVCFADLNNLKVINDRWGHDHGDEVILALCRILRETVRGSDIVCRLGGDEFLVILPGCNRARADQLWERVRKRIDLHNSLTSGQARLSVSHGFACYDPRNPVRLDELIRVADQEMYRDKKRSRAVQAGC